ncbi:MAG: hypothetical protein UV42_C0031G0007 [Candidatus Magasanikbacteria bacterium GW2011_GWE2_42_7]|uniref:Uncharacterized protein n=1 Tax=Candidatus Magasanikbacteria bacterium GW2011_GWE2_42_7 TaxID=1619052 RepID=A0A0G1E9U7_9BACT|nr:MAG: hypothetical protein UV42_C0031G0007 [Candidatus Magasanikbacteria bacterium GW2011_GWE2_42_7]
MYTYRSFVQFMYQERIEGSGPSISYQPALQGGSSSPSGKDTLCVRDRTASELCYLTAWVGFFCIKAILR